ncbi:MAG TPA: alpha/beta hydrolase-fold protein [Actinomycetota bacterium]|nr:alpha/beta hydrolase-fold protein [Actinomycetota bacterium]
MPERSAALVVALWLAASACERGIGRLLPGGGRGDGGNASETGPGRLSARSGRPTERPPAAGEHRLPIGGKRNGVVQIPAGYERSRPAPLVIVLHGAGGEAARRLFAKPYERFGLVVVAPESRGRNWDLLEGGGFGSDVAWLDRVLRWTFSRFRIDPNRVAIAGFSDGASYALSLGLSNGDLFTHVMAFSPGFVAPAERVGRPSIFVSHGRDDPVLSFENARDEIVPRLRDWGYGVRFVPFDGAHDVPLDVSRGAVRWFLRAR